MRRQRRERASGDLGASAPLCLVKQVTHSNTHSTRQIYLDRMYLYLQAGAGSGRRFHLDEALAAPRPAFCAVLKLIDVFMRAL